MLLLTKHPRAKLEGVKYLSPTYLESVNMKRWMNTFKPELGRLEQLLLQRVSSGAQREYAKIPNLGYSTPTGNQCHSTVEKHLEQQYPLPTKSRPSSKRALTWKPQGKSKQWRP